MKNNKYYLTEIIKITLLLSSFFLISCVSSKKVIKVEKLKKVKEEESLITSEFEKLAITCKESEKMVCKKLKLKIEDKIKNSEYLTNLLKKDSSEIKDIEKLWAIGFLLRYRYISESISTSFFEKACDLDDKKSCRELGIIYYYGDFGKQDLKKSEYYLNKGCNLDDGNSCLYLGKLYFFQGKGYDKVSFYFDLGCKLNDSSACNSLENFFKFISKKGDGKYYEKSCTLGDSLGCYNYLESVYRGKISINKEKIEYALKVLDDNCNLDETSSCTQLGNLYTDFKTIILSDRNRSKEYFIKGCNLDDPESCNNLAYYINEKEKDYSKAYENLYKACTMEFPVSCVHLGFYHTQGLFVEKNLRLGFNYHKKSCKLNKSLCFKLGNYYYDIDISKAKEILDIGCKANKGNSCYRLATIYKKRSDDKNMKLFFEKSIQLLEKECSKNILNSCLTLGYAYYSGVGVIKDNKKSKKYYTKSCNLGDTKSCGFINYQ